MNDGAAVLLRGYTTEIPPPRGVLGVQKPGDGQLCVKLRSNMHHSAKRAVADVLSSFYCCRWTRRRTDGRRCAASLLFDGRLEQRAAGVRGVPWHRDPRGFIRFPSLFLALPAHNRCKGGTCIAGMSSARRPMTTQEMLEAPFRERRRTAYGDVKSRPGSAEMFTSRIPTLDQSQSRPGIGRWRTCLIAHIHK